jgi:hypothetical protein
VKSIGGCFSDALESAGFGATGWRKLFFVCDSEVGLNAVTLGRSI